jgi:peptidyl-prolyl cis-trans isomerase D
LALACASYHAEPARHARAQTYRQFDRQLIFGAPAFSTASVACATTTGYFTSMLEAMRRGAQSWVAKGLFGILVASFAMWGVADVFRGVGRGSLASIGTTQISSEDYSREFQRELERFSREAKQRITPEQARAIGLDRRVLSQMLGGAAIETHAQKLGLGISDQALIDSIQDDPGLKGPDGKFSKPTFLARLREMGLSERGFLSLYRKDELRTQVIGSLVKGLAVPKPTLELANAYNQEKRVLEWIAIDAEKAVTVAEPDEAKLKERFEAGKARFMTPEYRKFQLLTLSIDDLKKSVTVTDDEVSKAYAATKDSYDTPEQRRVQQLSFKDKATAEAALKALRDGSKSFGDVAKESGAKDTDADLGLIKKKSLIDTKIADAAFALEKDKFSDVVEGKFTTVIVRVTQIEPGKTETFESVKDKVRDKLAAEKAKGEMQKKRDEVDDSRSAGKTLKEIAETLKLQFQDIAGADAKGNGPDLKPVLNTPDLGKIMSDVFAPDAGNNDQGTELASGGFAWVNLLGTDAPKQRPFDEVKADVKIDYTLDERKRLVTDLANKLVERLNAGEAMSALEAAAFGKAEKTEAITRTTVPQGVSEAAVAQAFAFQVGKSSSAETSDKTSRIVFKVAEVTPAPAATKEQLDALSKNVQADLTSQVLNEYTESLKKSLNASVNEAELKRAFGGSDQ